MTRPTRLSRIGAAILAIVAAAGCGESEDSDLAAVLSANTNMPPELVACIVADADDKLSADGRQFLVASMRKDDATAQDLRARMPLTELAEAGMFMASAASRCSMQVPN